MHRLLPSIVFASVSLLTGCSGAIADDEADGTTKDAGARPCEAGWPTTKGVLCTFEAGVRCCKSTHDPSGKTECCVGAGP